MYTLSKKDNTIIIIINQPNQNLSGITGTYFDLHNHLSILMTRRISTDHILSHV